MMRHIFTISLIGAVLILASCASHPAERNNAGNDLYDRGAYNDAVQAYQIAQVNDPDRPEAYYNAASALSSSGRVQVAIAALEQALKTADEDLAAQAYHNLGNIYFGMALYADALAAYREALLLRPDDADTRYNYELTLLRLPTPPPNDTEPEEDEAEPTPTAESNDGDEPQTATPTPAESATPEPEQGESSTPTPSTPTPNPNSELSVEDAERILDAIQQDQKTLREFLNSTTIAPTVEKDW